MRKLMHPFLEIARDSFHLELPERVKDNGCEVIFLIKLCVEKNNEGIYKILFEHLKLEIRR